jgi:hypothetical protein
MAEDDQVEHGNAGDGRTRTENLASEARLDAADQQRAARGSGRHRSVAGVEVLLGNGDGQ